MVKEPPNVDTKEKKTSTNKANNATKGTFKDYKPTPPKELKLMEMFSRV